MTELSRRSFLKLIGVCAGGIAASKIIPPLEMIGLHEDPWGDNEWIGSLRRISQYDVYNDGIIHRVDAMVGRTIKEDRTTRTVVLDRVIGVDYIIPIGLPKKDAYERCEKPALAALRSLLIREGIKPRDLYCVKDIPLYTEGTDLPFLQTLPYKDEEQV